MPCMITWAWSFLTSEVVEAVRGQKHHNCAHILALKLNVRFIPQRQSAYQRFTKKWDQLWLSASISRILEPTRRAWFLVRLYCRFCSASSLGKIPDSRNVLVPLGTLLPSTQYLDSFFFSRPPLNPTVISITNLPKRITVIDQSFGLLLVKGDVQIKQTTTWKGSSTKILGANCQTSSNVALNGSFLKTSGSERSIPYLGSIYILRKVIWGPT